MFVRRCAIAVAVFTLIAVACSEGSPSVSATSPSVTGLSPSPSVASPSPSPVPSPSGSPALAEGRSFGYIKSVDATASPPTMVFDLAQFFSGADADKAAQEDGVIGPGEHVDNDFYIRNVNPLLRTVPISATVQISLIKWTNCCETKLSPDLATFASAFPGPGPTDDFHGPMSPYWLTVKNGVIVKIEEQYLP
jgi:hypothetical protein